MKKALIAMSIAAGMTAAAHAENTTTLYGSLGFQTQIEKAADVDVKDSVKNNRWDLSTATSKFGIKGNEDLGAGTQAFFKFQFGVGTGVKDDDTGVNKTSYAYIGLRGDNWGTVTLGKQDSLYKKVVNYNDIFNSVFYGDELAHFEKATGGSQLSKAISYVSPNWSGFQFGAAGVLDGNHDVVTDARSKSFDAAQAGVWYDQNGIYAGLAYSWIQHASDDTKVIGGAVGYSNDQFRVGLGAEHKFSSGQVYNLAGEYYYGPNTFRAGFSYADKKVRNNDKGAYSYALGYQYNLSKRTYTWVEGEYTDLKNKDIKNGYTVKVGLRHDF